MLKKVSLVIAFIFLPIITFAQYTGGSYDGYAKGETDGGQTLPVVLSTFVAQYLNNTPTLYWVTQSEEDIIGWYIYRSLDNDFENAEQINENLIPGNGTTTEPSEYLYEDISLQAIPGKTYWYWIESIDLGGQINSYDPVQMFVTDPGTGNPPQEEIEHDGLYLAVPNPFNTDTGIELFFELENISKVELQIFNCKGQLVKTLFSGFSGSEKNLAWYGKDENGVKLATGMYLCKLKVDDKVYDMEKIILMR